MDTMTEPFYLHQGGYVCAFVCLSVSSITQKLSTKFNEMFGRVDFDDDPVAQPTVLRH